MSATKDLSRFEGREPDRLSIPEMRALHGHWIAMEIYTPQSLPAKKIVAVGLSAADCVLQLSKRGLEPRIHEYILMRSPL